MGMPTKTQTEAQTDAIAARIAVNLAGLRAELGAGTVNPLSLLVDATGDQDYEAAMMQKSLNLDRHSLPANLKDALPVVLNRAAYGDWVRTWEAFMTSVPGGSQDNIRAYLDGLDAQVDPLFAEMVRAIKGEAVFTDGDGLVQCVAAPTYSTQAPARVYIGTDGSLTDKTTEAASATAADVEPFASDDDVLYVGFDDPFTHLIPGLSTVSSADIAGTWTYSRAANYATLTKTDNSTGFSVRDLATWTPPADWARTNKDAAGNAFADTTPRYYLRIQRTANTVVTPPVLTCLRIVPSAVLNASGSHLGVAQPPLAIVRVTGATTLVVEAIASLAHLRFRPQPIAIRALTPGLGTAVITAAYIDQDGNTPAHTQLQSALSSPAALAEIAVALASPDTGVRSIDTSGWAVSGGSRGVFEIYVPSLRTPTL